MSTLLMDEIIALRAELRDIYAQVEADAVDRSKMVAEVNDPMTTPEPPNYRDGIFCATCKHYASWQCYECQKHRAGVKPWKICDDYEPEAPHDSV